MNTRPHDTSVQSWRAQRAALERMDAESRVRAATDLSDAVRELQIQGALARNPGWSRSEAIDALVERLIGHRPRWQ